MGFPGGAVVENLPANAGDTGSSPGLGRSHMPRSSWAREPQLLSLRVWSLCPATGGPAIEKGPRTAMKSGPRLPQLEKALARTEDPTQPKIKKIKKKDDPGIHEKSGFILDYDGIILIESTKSFLNFILNMTHAGLIKIYI